MIQNCCLLQGRCVVGDRSSTAGLSLCQTIVTFQRNISQLVGCNMLRAFGHPVAICCNMLGVVSSSLKLVKFEPTTPNMSQHGGQTHTCCTQQCCDMLCWHVTRSFGRGFRRKLSSSISTSISMALVQKREKDEAIDHFTVVGIVTWPLNGSEAGVDLVLI